MEIISLDRVLKDMEKVDESGAPVPFSATIITCDLNRKRGGERISYTQAVLCTPTGGSKAYHARNNTRNIQGLGNNEVRSINPLLITHFNGKEVSL
jgi:hypothetical protein